MKEYDIASKELTDMSIGINEVNEQKSFRGIEALKFQIQKLLIMDKGTIPSIPNMGVGIRQYRYGGDTDINPLIEEIEDQISKYIAIGGNIKVTYRMAEGEKTLNINIEIDGKIIPFLYDGEKIETLNI